MVKYIKLSILFLALINFTNCAHKNQKDNDWQILFDGSALTGWDTYLGPQIKPDMKRSDFNELPHLGLNNDTIGVFKIVNLDGENVLRVSGEIWGGISTQQEFENYHLQLQFKWGEKKWYPRDKENDRRDSGLIYHGVGEHGVGDGFWLKSQEFQIQEGDCGDYWGVAGAIEDVKATLNADSIYQYDPTGQLLTFSQYSSNNRHVKKYPNAEKPSGEWNTLDLYCYGGTSVHVVNNIVTMVLQNSRHQVDGKELPLTKGKIQIQSEAAEVYYRAIKLQAIDAIPSELLK
jgi:hypothetical protein